MMEPLIRVAPPVVLDTQQRKTLEQWARSRSLFMRQVQRAQIILLAADGKQDLEIAAEVNISSQKAARWRKRFLKKGVPGLEKDAPRPVRAEKEWNYRRDSGVQTLGRNSRCAKTGCCPSLPLHQ
jgi:hypothetical protein